MTFAVLSSLFLGISICLLLMLAVLLDRLTRRVTRLERAHRVGDCGNGATP